VSGVSILHATNPAIFIDDVHFLKNFGLIRQSFFLKLVENSARLKKGLA
jgi:hypothetical protein